MDNLKDRIKEDMKSSMKAGNKPRLNVIRLIMAAIKQVEVDQRIELDDDAVIVVLDKMVKQRRESIRQYRDAGRDDLAAIEDAEISVIREFLPQPLSELEIEQMIKSAITDSGAQSMRDMGKVMGVLKPAMQGRADMADVSAKIKHMLN